MASNIERPGAPTTSTVGEIGCIYTDTITGQQYECISKHEYTTMKGPLVSYIWKLIIEEESGGGSDLAKYFEEQHEEVILPNVTKIKPYAFYYDSVVTSVSLPDATVIGSYAFFGYSGSSGGSILESVSMPKVTSIGAYAFQYCRNLKTIDLPEGLTYIGASAFTGCTSLTSVTLPSTLATLGFMAFSACSNVKTVTFLGKPTSIAQTQAYMNPFPATVEVINVPWAEGEVDGAPWGATKATINYNYTGD